MQLFITFKIGFSFSSIITEENNLQKTLIVQMLHITLGYFTLLQLNHLQLEEAF